jgi:hypothetical protein
MITYLVYFSRIDGSRKYIDASREDSVKFWDNVARFSGPTFYRLPYIIRCWHKEKLPS